MTKILDKYFTKKAMGILKIRCGVVFCDKKIVKTKRGYEFYVKNKKLNDNHWKLAYECKFGDGLERCMQWYFAEGIPEYINRLVSEDITIGEVQID